MKRRNERPTRRRNPSGKTVWVARWTNWHGHRSSAGTFELRGPCRAPRDDGECCAQHAIDAAYRRDEAAALGPQHVETVRSYFGGWLDRHPRTARTERAYRQRVRAVLEVQAGGRVFGDWPMADVRPREVVDLLDHLLRVDGRAASGAQGVLNALAAMWRNAILDDAAHLNPFREVSVRSDDPRIRKQPRGVQLWSWEQMHAFAAAAAVSEPDAWPSLQVWRRTYAEPMVRCLSDCGLRLGEMFALERADLRLNGCQDPGCRAGAVPHLHVQRTAYDGVVERGTKSHRGELGRVAPVPDALAGMLRALPARLDTRLLFPSARGGVVQNQVFYRNVWRPARVRSGMTRARPHDFRHAWVSYMRAAGADAADVASASGHSVQTATSVYTHSLGGTFDLMRRAVG